MVFGTLNSEFSFFNDFVSKLGANGQKYAIWWNIIGFGAVGVLLFLFGINYGKVIKDNFAGILLALFGVGFSLTAVPVDFNDSDSPISKMHVLAICFALAFWLFGLARISYNSRLCNQVKKMANFTAIFVVLPMFAVAFEIISMPITHRLVFAVVFGWTLITAIKLIRTNS